MGLFSKKAPSNNATNTGAVPMVVAEESIPVATMVVNHDSFDIPTNNPPPTAPRQQHQNQSVTYSMNQHADPSFTRFPMMDITCAQCHQVGRTKVRTAPAWQTWAATGVGFLLFWPLCWLPLVMDSCKKSEHFCTNCGHKLGTVAPFQDCCVNTRN